MLGRLPPGEHEVVITVAQEEGPGSKFRWEDFPANDAHGTTRSRYVGKTCTAEMAADASPLHSSPPGSTGGQ